MKLCDTCIYRNNVEQLKPCIIYRDNCEYYEKERDMTKETREEAIKYLKRADATVGREIKTKTAEALEMAIKALEQEPKTGHWIETAEEYYKAINEKGGGVNEDTEYFTDDIACSECLAKFSVIDNETEQFDFCPKCGAKMVEPQESEGEG